MTGGFVIGGMLGQGVTLQGLLPLVIVNPSIGFVDPRAMRQLPASEVRDPSGVDPKGIKLAWDTVDPRGMKLISTDDSPLAVDPNGIKLIH